MRVWGRVGTKVPAPIFTYFRGWFHVPMPYPFWEFFPYPLWVTFEGAHWGWVQFSSLYTKIFSWALWCPSLGLVFEGCYTCDNIPSYMLSARVQRREVLHKLSTPLECCLLSSRRCVLVPSQCIIFHLRHSFEHYFPRPWCNIPFTLLLQPGTSLVSRQGFIEVSHIEPILECSYAYFLVWMD